MAGPIHTVGHGKCTEICNTEFVGELESIYSAFADVSMSSLGGPMWNG